MGSTKLSGSAPNLDDRPRRCVPENHRFLNDGLADSDLLKMVDVAAADANCAHADGYLIGLDSGCLDFVDGHCSFECSTPARTVEGIGALVLCEMGFHLDTLDVWRQI